MLIKDAILKTMLPGAQERLRRLVELDAPEIILDQQKQKVAMLESGDLPLKDKEGLLGLELVGEPEVKTGSGGKQYLEMNTSTGAVLFFPQARFGWFLTKKSEGR